MNSLPLALFAPVAPSPRPGIEKEPAAMAGIFVGSAISVALWAAVVVVAWLVIG